MIYKKLNKSKRRELREEVYSLWIGERRDMPMAMNIFANHLLEVVDREIKQCGHANKINCPVCGN